MVRSGVKRSTTRQLRHIVAGKCGLLTDDGPVFFAYLFIDLDRDALAVETVCPVLPAAGYPELGTGLDVEVVRLEPAALETPESAPAVVDGQLAM